MISQTYHDFIDRSVRVKVKTGRKVNTNEVLYCIRIYSNGHNSQRNRNLLYETTISIRITK